MADMAPLVNFDAKPKSPKADARAPKPRKRPLPGTVASAHSRPAKPPEPMAIARLMKTLAPMIAGGGGR